MSPSADDQNEQLLQDAEQVLQSAPAYGPRSHREQRLLEVLDSVAPLPLGVKDIAEHLGESPHMVRAMLQYLALFGEVRRVRTGMFTHVPPDCVKPPERPTARPQRIPSTDERLRFHIGSASALLTSPSLTKEGCDTAATCLLPLAQQLKKRVLEFRGLDEPEED